MENIVHSLKINLDWDLLGIISQIDRFDASWGTIEKREGKTLKQLKSIATIQSVGASTRIEGSMLSNEEVESLLNEINITKLTERDNQEVVGYFDTLDLITENFMDIDISEGSLKNLHNILMKHSQKDAWHKGDYKQHSNAVQAIFADGNRKIIFNTTEPGIQTRDAIKALIDWYIADTQTHPLVKCALFTYELLSVHPFQDGNGRMSRLLSTLLLLKNGYSWIQYISFEHEIENRKTEYYKVLRSCQANRPNENITEWLIFYFEALKQIQINLIKKLETKASTTILSSKAKLVYSFIENNPTCKTGEISVALNIPIPTVKRILADLVSQLLILKKDKGAATNYVII